MKHLKNLLIRELRYGNAKWCLLLTASLYIFLGWLANNCLGVWFSTGSSQGFIPGFYPNPFAESQVRTYIDISIFNWPQDYYIITPLAITLFTPFVCFVSAASMFGFGKFQTTEVISISKGASVIDIVMSKYIICASINIFCYMSCTLALLGCVLDEVQLNLSPEILSNFLPRLILCSFIQLAFLFLISLCCYKFKSAPALICLYFLIDYVISFGSLFVQIGPILIDLSLLVSFVRITSILCGLVPLSSYVYFLVSMFLFIFIATSLPIYFCLNHVKPLVRRVR